MWQLCLNVRLFYIQTWIALEMLVSGVLDSVLWIPREDHMLEVDNLLLGSRLEFSQVKGVFGRLKWWDLMGYTRWASGLLTKHTSSPQCSRQFKVWMTVCPTPLLHLQYLLPVTDKHELNWIAYIGEDGKRRVGKTVSTGASEPGTSLHAYHCSTKEAEAGGLGIQVQPALGGKVPDSPGLLERLSKPKPTETWISSSSGSFIAWIIGFLVSAPLLSAARLGLWVGLLPVTSAPCVIVIALVTCHPWYCAMFHRYPLEIVPGASLALYSEPIVVRVL